MPFAENRAAWKKRVDGVSDMPRRWTGFWIVVLLLSAVSTSVYGFDLLKRQPLEGAAYDSLGYFYLLGAVLLAVALLLFWFVSYRHRIPLGLFWNALKHWITYSPHEYAAGVIRPPATWHLWFVRKAAVMALVAAICLTALPLAYYFPFLLNTGERWQSTVSIPAALVQLGFPEQQENHSLSYGEFSHNQIDALPLQVGKEFAAMHRTLDKQRNFRGMRLDILRWQLDPKFASNAIAEKTASFFVPEEMRNKWHETAPKPFGSEDDPDGNPRLLSTLQYVDCKSDLDFLVADLTWPRPKNVSYHGMSLDNNTPEYRLGGDLHYWDAIRDVVAPSKEYSWLTLAVAGLGTEHRTYFIWSIALAFLGCLTTPVFLFFTVASIASGPLLALATRELKEECSFGGGEVGEEAAARWENRVAVLQNSDDEVESESIWLGIHEYGDYPVMVPREVLHEHAHILGDTGTLRAHPASAFDSPRPLSITAPM